MHITLSPIRSETPLTLHRAGDVLTVNGEVFDLSGIPEGATLPRGAVACDWLASDVTRVGGALVLTIQLPHGANAPEETRHPAALVLTANGPVSLPPYEIAAEEIALPEEIETPEQPPAPYALQPYDTPEESQP
jgi:hypothetical protein